jgi:hypothetical protein
MEFLFNTFLVIVAFCVPHSDTEVASVEISLAAAAQLCRAASPFIYRRHGGKLKYQT